MSDWDLEAAKTRETLNSYIEEVYRLRFNADVSKPGEGPSEILARLMTTRKSLDRIEELFMSCLRVKAKANRMKDSAQATVEDEWDQAVMNTRSATVVRGSDMIGPRERYANANLATLATRRNARSVAELASVADEAVDVIRVAYRGLDSVRQDLNTVLRTLQFESSLER